MSNREGTCVYCRGGQQGELGRGVTKEVSEKPEWIETEVGCVRECCDSKEESSFPTYPT